jgi:PAS domain S-box-containing protein
MTNSTSSLTVLLVEDDADTRANLCELLELDGHISIESSSVHEALTSPPWDRIDAVILDRRLPDGDAGMLLPMVKQRSPDCPVVVVTGYPDVDSAIEALRQGAYDYLLKPVSPEALRASLRRIAERRDTIQQLRTQRDLAESLIETAQAIVLVLDFDCAVVRCNGFLKDLIGQELLQSKGKTWLRDWIPSADQHRFEKMLNTIIQGVTVRDQASRLKVADGTERLISWSGKQLDGNQDVRGLLLVGHDVTELNRAQHRMVQSERLAAIGQMITGLAHESRNAFQRSQACLEMLGLEVQDRPAAMELIQRIQRAQDHLHHLYEEVRFYAAPIHLERVSCRLETIWRETWRHLEKAWSVKRIVLNEPPVLPDIFVQADSHALERVFRNLFENAILASPQDSCVDLNIVRCSLGDRLGIEIRVRDHGHGLDRATRERIFEPFFTTRTQGTGLGLPITKRLIEAHGGSLEFGWPEDGAEAIVRLPIAPETHPMLLPR